MPSHPLVTVILTSFNHAPFIDAALKSVLDQSVAELEVLVIDDASSDATTSRLARYDDPRLRLIANRVNRGAHLRNLALRQARGRFVAFQNSDDLWRPGKLAAQVAFMEANPEAGACFTAVDLCDEEGIPCPDDPHFGSIFRVEQNTRAQWLHRFFHRGNCLALPSAVVRMSTLRQTELMDSSLFQVADLDLWIQLAARAGLAVLPEPLTVLRVRSHGRNLSAPSVPSHNRATREMITVLQRFARPPLLAQLDIIFGDELEPPSARDASEECSALVRLGLLATSSHHRHIRLAGLEFLELALRRADSESGLSEETRARAAHRLFLLSGELDAAVESSRAKACWAEVTVQVFWHAAADSFSEEQSARATCVLSAEPLRISLRIPPCRDKIAALRLDPAAEPVAILILELVIYDLHGQQLWQCPFTDPSSFETVALKCLLPPGSTGLVLECSSRDPQWILPVPPSVFAEFAHGVSLEFVAQLMR